MLRDNSNNNKSNKKSSTKRKPSRSGDNSGSSINENDSNTSSLPTNETMESVIAQVESMASPDAVENDATLISSAVAVVDDEIKGNKESKQIPSGRKKTAISSVRISNFNIDPYTIGIAIKP